MSARELIDGSGLRLRERAIVSGGRLLKKVSMATNYRHCRFGEKSIRRINLGSRGWTVCVGATEAECWAGADRARCSRGA
jgi:hypothetical protein